jgi:predicted ATPase
MENAINTLRIQNFKSIKDVTMQPRRVNLIIGPPNVGKSNILEAMSLLGGMMYEQTDEFMGSFIRYEEPRQLLYDNLLQYSAKITTENNVAIIVYDKFEKLFKYYFGNIEMYQALDGHIDVTFAYHDKFKNDTDFMRQVPRGRVKMKDLSGLDCLRYIYTEFENDRIFKVEQKKGVTKFFDATYKPPMLYVYKKKIILDNNSTDSFLTPPYGVNIIDIIQLYPHLRKEIAEMFVKYGLKLLVRVDERRLEVIKDLDGVVYSYPYSSIADTLQRIIFYFAAIESNDDTVILLEEPEAHSYPVYVSMLGQRIVESRNNQFFVATHSPYLVTEILEQMTRNDTLDTELAIFVAYYEDYQTKVRQLTNEEVRTIRNDAVDVFINMDRFTPAAPDA